MFPRRQDYGLKRSGGARSGSMLSFRSAVNSGSVRRSSAVLPSLLTFLVIIASGGLLLMIEKGMLNGMETPSPRGSGDGRRLDFSRHSGERSREAVDLESQVGGRSAPWSCAFPRANRLNQIRFSPTACFRSQTRGLGAFRAVSSVKCSGLVYVNGRFSLKQIKTAFARLLKTDLNVISE